MATMTDIPEQISIPWTTALAVSWAAVKRRFLRSMITMSGIVLAIAFLSYMLTLESVTQALVAVGDDKLNLILQEAGVDVWGGAKTDRLMILLLGLSLLTCTSTGRPIPANALYAVISCRYDGTPESGTMAKRSTSLLACGSP